MKSTDLNGVWSHKLNNGTLILVDMNHNQIRVIPLNGNVIKYEYEEDITVREFAQIIENHKK